MYDIWNPWHGCIKKSEGCANCYMYFLDKKRNQDGSRLICNGCTQCSACERKNDNP